MYIHVGSKILMHKLRYFHVKSELNTLNINIYFFWCLLQEPPCNTHFSAFHKSHKGAKFSTIKWKLIMFIGNINAYFAKLPNWN